MDKIYLYLMGMGDCMRQGLRMGLGAYVGQDLVGLGAVGF